MPPEIPPITPADGEAMNKIVRDARTILAADEDPAIDEKRNMNGQRSADAASERFVESIKSDLDEESYRFTSGLLKDLSSKLSDPIEFKKVIGLMSREYKWTESESEERIRALYDAVQEYRNYRLTPPDEDRRIRWPSKKLIVPAFPDFVESYIGEKYGAEFARSMERLIQGYSKEIGGFLVKYYSGESDGENDPNVN